MNHEELLEYSTVIQMLRAEIAAKDEALWAIAGATQANFERETIVQLAMNALKSHSRRIDFEDVTPE